MSVEINPVLIPEDVDLERSPNPRDTFAPGELVNFDHKTLFYDVFIDEKDSSLVAIGPPGLNLNSYMESASLVVNGKKTPFLLSEHEEHKLSFMKANLAPANDYEVVFQFKDFHVTLRLKGLTVPVGKSVLVAISKNNKVEWVSDWVDFYRANYDLDEIYIYDNGSDNVDELERELAGRAEIIRWGYPYGPPGKRFNKFAQPGALNHCLRRFAKDGVLFNFDIDELLIANRQDLDADIEKNGTLYLASYNVPFVKLDKSRYSYYDFCHREPRRKKSARKFVCRYDAVDIISQHNTWTYGKLLFKKRLKRNKPERLESRRGFFMHFLGITTNWQPELEKLKEVPLETLVRDTSHIEMKPNGD